MEIFLENLFTTYSNFDYSVLFYLTAFLSVSVVAISKSCGVCWRSLDCSILWNEHEE